MRPPVQLFDLTAGLASPALPLFRARVSALRGPLVGIDVGTRHVGVAVSDDG